MGYQNRLNRGHRNRDAGRRQAIDALADSRIIIGAAHTVAVRCGHCADTVAVTVAAGTWPTVNEAIDALAVHWQANGH